MDDDVSKNKKISPGRKALFSLIIILISFLILEGGIRVAYIFRNAITPRSSDFSEKLGWITRANANAINTFKGYGKVHYSTTTHGFRKFGDVTTQRTKIFVIGDSQTAARKVNDGETFYDYLGARMNTEIFAYGGGGYGTLQEYMILDEHIDTIRPDIILWQFCSNDIINNSFDLESSSWKNNNHMTRPYYDHKEGKIEYRFPHRSWIYRNILRHSYLIKFFNIRLNILLADNFEPMPSQFLSKDNPHFREAVKTTHALIKLIKKRAAHSQIIAFSGCDKTENNVENRAFADICKETGIFYIHGIPAAIGKAAADGHKIDGMPYDPHWNGAAHTIAGEIIAGYLIKNKFLKSKEHSRSNAIQ